MINMVYPQSHSNKIHARLNIVKEELNRAGFLMRSRPGDVQNQMYYSSVLEKLTIWE